MRNWMQLGPISLLAASGLLFSLPGCEEIKEQCNLECAEEGIVEGNASISGVARVDAFFGAVVNFTGTANRVSGNIEAQLNRIRASLGLEVNATPAQIVARIESRYRLEGGVRVVYREPRCAVDAQATLQAQARCDVQVDPGTASVKCEGTCEVEAGVAVDCGASAEVECVGTAPQLECAGTCEGSCELTAAAECTGTCRGTCEGTCSATGADGQCAGQCDGECEGTCELTAGGECKGQCKGECTYTPPSGECEANATVRCKAEANAQVDCRGRCEGEVTPPKASAECEASAKAEAKVNVQCTPPSVDVEYQFSANANAQVQAEFEAFLVTFRSSMSAIASELSRAKIVIVAGEELLTAAGGAVSGAVDASLEGDLSIRESTGLLCAVSELGNVGDAIEDSATRLEGQISVATDLTTKLGAGS